MNHITGVLCALTLLGISFPAHAEERSHPSPTTTARRSGENIHGAHLHGRKLREADVPTRRHGSNVDVRTGDDGRKPQAAKIAARKAKR